MALVECRECKVEVSDSAMKCPSCGFQLKKPKRGIFGKLFKWIFILFNILMVVWLFAGFQTAAEVSSTAGSDAESAGAAIGTAIGVSFILGIWVVGDIVLGLFVLFTRPKG